MSAGAVPVLSNKAVGSALTEFVKRYDVFLQVWPVYSLYNHERSQAGLELELFCSHTSDPSHLDPNCSECRRARSALYFIAEYFTHEFNSNGSLPLFCTISPLS